MKKYPITRLVKYIKSKRNERRRKIRSFFFKLVFLLIEIHGLTMVTVSYILAWNDRGNVLETLSGTLVTEIIAPFIVYAISRFGENMLEKNVTKFHTPISELQEDAKG